MHLQLIHEEAVGDMKKSKVEAGHAETKKLAEAYAENMSMKKLLLIVQEKQPDKKLFGRGSTGLEDIAECYVNVLQGKISE